jgi:tetratricopeptide (TPR) repeat protein
VLAYERVMQTAPDDVRGPCGRGRALLAQGHYDLAAASFRAALEVDPGHADARWSLATALLAAGDFEAGWAAYECRWARRGVDPAARFAWPLWDGGALAGRRILVWREGRPVDELRFAACLRDLASAGAEVTFAASPALRSLFARSLAGIEVVADGDPCPGPFDCHAPLGSLPRHVRASRVAFPAEQPLFAVDAAQATRWAERLGRLAPGARVGISWRGGEAGAEAGAGAGRPLPALEDWEAVFSVPGVQWVNLDAAGDEAAAIGARHGVRLHCAGRDRPSDPDSLAGLLWNLDAVVTLPGMLSPLAGGVGTRVWQVETGMDWTFHGEHRSPWFSALARVHRPAGAAWSAVLARLADDLRAFLEAKCAAA